MTSQGEPPPPLSGRLFCSAHPCCAAAAAAALTIALSRQGWQAQKLISALGTNNINATNAYYRIRNSYYVDSIG